MSGKPAVRKQPAQAQPTPPKSAPAEKQPSAAKEPAADNPFDDTPATTKTAIQALPKPAKGRLHKVICPMCDTAGFVARKAAGRDVRCANKKCLVPVFRAPAPRKKAPPAEPEPAKSTNALPVIGGVLGLILVAGILWAVLGPKGDDDSKKTDPVKTPDTAAQVQAKLRAAELKRNKPIEKAGPIPLAQLRNQILDTLANTARQRNADKAFCRRMTSEALVAAGRFEDVAAEIKLIARRQESRQFNRVFPLCESAWVHLAKGRQAEANTAIDEAVSYATTLPGFGRTEFDVRTALSAVLAAVGREKEAIAMIATTRDMSDRLNRQSALASADYSMRFAFEQTSRDYQIDPVGDWTQPSITAVAVTLYLHQKADAALSWAAAAKDPRVRADTLATLAALAAETGDVAGVEASGTAAGSNDAIRARVHAAAAAGFARAKNSVATDWLTRAEGLARTLPEPQPVTIEGLSDLYRYEAAAASPRELAATAWAEIARAQCALRDPAAAEPALETAIRHVQSFCPSPQYLQTRQSNLSSDADRVRNELAKTLNLSDAEARSAFFSLNARVQKLQKSAATRSDILRSLLANLARSALRDQIQSMITADSSSPLNEERLNETDLPWQINAEAAWAGDATQKDTRGASAAVAAEIEALRNAASPYQAGSILSPASNTDTARLAAIYRLSARYADQGIPSVIDFARGIRNPAWQREVLNLAGIHLARTGHARKLFERATDADLDPPAQTALLRGIVVGVAMDPKFRD